LGKKNKSNTYSKKLIETVAARTRQIAATPYIFKRADYPNTRVTSLGNYSIYYKIKGEEIIVSAFWDNRQDQKKLLKILREVK